MFHAIPVKISIRFMISEKFHIFSRIHEGFFVIIPQEFQISEGFLEDLWGNP